MRRISLFWVGSLISLGYLAFYVVGEGDGLGLIGVFGFVVMVLGGVLDAPEQHAGRNAERD